MHTPAWVIAAVCLAIATIAVWVAALMPQFYPVWAGQDPLAVIGAHAGLWRVNAVLFLGSAIATLVGVALAVPTSSSPLAVPSLLVLTTATALWSFELALRLSVVPAVAQDRTSEGEAWLNVAQSWSATAWYIAAVLLILAFAGIGAIIVTTALMPVWVGWVTLASAVASAALFIAIRDMPPVVVYFPVLTLAVGAVIEAFRRS